MESTKADPVLLLTGRKCASSNVVDEDGTRVFRVRGEAIAVSERANVQDNTGFIVWDAALALTKYLEENASRMVREGCMATSPSSSSSKRTVIELGAGTGLVGLASAKLFRGSDCVLTDLPVVVPQLEKNIRLNEGVCSAVSARPLDWSWSAERVRENFADVADSVTLVLASDCVWLRDQTKDFVKVAALLCGGGLKGGGASAKLVVAQQRRSAALEDALRRELEAAGFRDAAPKVADDSANLRIWELELCL
ncbi:lysine methyltransferase [Chloropicon primus]|uniref:Lysine methyltransferase n=1 Tax=Chloropicon primus TaxID=1764295 RepID=A0A5B8MTU0_9CHLO|nr:lysine methyltransferase [Chloropicon primus]UPR02387.1 lysine methyltransferase [Chloropicon primus]|mmetsp:Transcript_6308/g.18748  ORF Transcript_6308/g.18748 Transcript_6308/m.18748 type:complete len:252 (+) Transcript_6308:182-937(+)|eukprot:QDZ23174.1 lysine methyltransferase [Chloropicon primus]